jgi:hypothetical protein
MNNRRLCLEVLEHREVPATMNFVYVGPAYDPAALTDVSLWRTITVQQTLTDALRIPQSGDRVAYKEAMRPTEDLQFNEWMRMNEMPGAAQWWQENGANGWFWIDLTTMPQTMLDEAWKRWSSGNPFSW